MDTIDGLRTFAAVAAEESFTAGARRLGISTRVASKYVQQLESRLGVQLFSRTTRSVRLTETGRACLERCLPLLDQFDEMEGLARATQSELAGSIRLSAPTAFGSSELPAALAGFQARHPAVQLNLRLDDRWVALVEEGFDLAVRFGNLEDSALLARRLLNMRMIAVASPGFLREHGEPKQPADLERLNCLILDIATAPEPWAFVVDGQRTLVQVRGGFRSNSPRAIAHMAAQGIGIGRCPHYVARPLLQSGQLQILLEEHEPSPIPLQALYPSNRHQSLRVRALIDHLVEYFSRYDSRVTLPWSASRHRE